MSKLWIPSLWTGPGGPQAYQRRTRAAAGGGAFTFINNVAAGSTTGNNVTTGDIDTTGVNLIILAISTYAGSATPSDSKTNTWSALTSYGGVGDKIRLYYSVNPTVGSGHNFTASSTALFPSIAVATFSGSHATPFDAENGGATATTGSITPVGDNELVVSGVSWYPGGTVSIDGTGFSITDQVNYVAGQHMGAALAYKIQASVGAENRTWSGVTFTEVATTIAAFKAA